MRMRLLPLPFDSVLSDLDAADLGRAGHVGAAVGLLVEADDVDDADLGDRLGDQADLRADEVVVGEGDASRQERHLDRVVGGDRSCVDEALDRRAEALGQGVELEVHPRAERLHVAARSPLCPTRSR